MAESSHMLKSSKLSTADKVVKCLSRRNTPQRPENLVEATNK